METFTQPKITGYRQLTATEAALMNEGKALAEQCGAFIAKLRTLPATGANGVAQQRAIRGGGDTGCRVGHAAAALLHAEVPCGALVRLPRGWQGLRTRVSEA
jgi:hypothetical protein